MRGYRVSHSLFIISTSRNALISHWTMGLYIEILISSSMLGICHGCLGRWTIPSDTHSETVPGSLLRSAQGPESQLLQLHMKQMPCAALGK